MFCINKRMFYPGHGVAKVNRVIQKNVGGKQVDFYELTFLYKEMTILVPTKGLSSVGVRKLSSSKQIDNLLHCMQNKDKDYGCDMQEELSQGVSWNRRNKDYQLKLRNGNMKDLFCIYKELKLIFKKKGSLSFGEKDILQRAEKMLAEEIATVESISTNKAVSYLRSPFEKDLSYLKRFSEATEHSFL